MRGVGEMILLANDRLLDLIRIQATDETKASQMIQKNSGECLWFTCDRSAYDRPSLTFNLKVTNAPSQIMFSLIVNQVSFLTRIKGVIKGEVNITGLGLVNQQKLNSLFVGWLDDSGASGQTLKLILAFLKGCGGLIVGQRIASQQQDTNHGQTSEAH